MRTTILLLSLALLLCQPKELLAQVEGEWQTFIDVSQINGQLELEESILFATDGGIVVYEKTNNQVLETWTRATHGLPSNMIEDIVQDPQTQQLIIGTYDLGVFRQSGSEIGNWEQIVFPESVNLEQQRIYSLAHDDQDRLLIGTNTGLWILDPAEDIWLQHGPSQTDNLLQEVWEMLTIDDGSVYASGNIVLKISGGDISVHSPVSIDQSASDSMHFAYGDRRTHLTPEGDIWSMTDLGQFTRFTAEGEWELYGWPFNHQNLSFSIFGNNFLDTDGSYVVQTSAGDYYRFQDTGFVSTTLPAEVGNLKNITLLDDRLIGHVSNSLYVSGPEATVQLAGEMGNWPWDGHVDVLFNDPQGNSWAKIGTDRIINLSQNEILQMPVSTSGNSSYRSFHFTDAPGGDMWLQGAYDFFHWQDRQELIAYPYAPGNGGTTDSWLRSTLVTADGTPWFTNSNQELFTLIDGQWVRRLQLSQNSYISSIIPFPSNRVLVTYFEFPGISQALLLGPTESEPFTFPDEMDIENYWSPFPGEQEGAVWFYYGDGEQLIKYYQGVVTTLDLPAGWEEPSLIRSFQELDGNIMIAVYDQVSIYDGATWKTFNHENSPIETTHISTANLDAAGVLRITHVNFRYAFESLQTDLVSSTEENELATSAVLGISVFPNPANEWITFSSEHVSDYQILNSLGQVVINGQSKIGSTRVELGSLPPGVYHLRLGRRAVSFLVER